MLVPEGVYKESLSTIFKFFEKYGIIDDESFLIFEDILVNCFKDMCEKKGAFVTYLLNLHILVNLMGILFYHYA